MIMNDLTYVKTVDEIEYYRFKPKFGKWYYKNYSGYRKHSLPHNVRMTIEYLEGGYEIFYMIQGGRVLGYLLVSRGGKRLKCSSRDDIVIGPIWVEPELRNTGIASKGISAVLHDLDITYKYAYEYIQPTNVSSIRTVEKNSFDLYGTGSSKGMLKRIESDGSEEFLIYRYSSEDK